MKQRIVVERGEVNNFINCSNAPGRWQLIPCLSKRTVFLPGKSGRRQWNVAVLIPVQLKIKKNKKNNLFKNAKAGSKPEYFSIHIH